jgi:hypothetical protein
MTIEELVELDLAARAEALDVNTTAGSVPSHTAQELMRVYLLVRIELLALAKAADDWEETAVGRTLALARAVDALRSKLESCAPRQADPLPKKRPRLGLD